MLAFRLPIAIAFDPAITAISLVLAILASALALYTLRWQELRTPTVVLSATLIGIGICAMHYTGMLAMRMSPPIHYQPALFVASVLIAIGASYVALCLAFYLRHRTSGFAIVAKLGSAVVMGLAITGMHYTGMAAAQFAPNSVCLAVDVVGGMDSRVLAVAVGVTTLVVLLLTLLVSSFDAQSAAQRERLVETLRDANRHLRSVALYDGLTGLPNRVLLRDRLEQAIRRAERSGKLFALMFVDLDRFKPVNDTYGHQTGDVLLRHVAERLTALVRKEDTVARSGGDEFVIVLANLAAREDAASVADKVVDNLSAPFEVESHTVSISCSVGVSMFPDDARDIEGLTANADAAMYEMKRQGRNGVRFFNAAGARAGADPVGAETT
jgi:diguanylate cyclase (GGDEF)-like protein